MSAEVFSDRNEMLSLLRHRGIRDERVLAAMARIAREDFIPRRLKPAAYEDRPVSIGYGQTISQPWMTAFMTQVLAIQGTEHVLEIGTGCGYHTAVLQQLAASVVSIEYIPELVEMARENLRRSKLDANVILLTGDGSLGAPEYAPYDCVLVAAGAPDIPQALLDQLAPGGRLVIPVGTLDDQELRLITRQNGTFQSSTVSLCRFVPLRGRQGWDSM